MKKFVVIAFIAVVFVLYSSLETGIQQEKIGSNSRPRQHSGLAKMPEKPMSEKAEKDTELREKNSIVEHEKSPMETKVIDPLIEISEAPKHLEKYVELAKKALMTEKERLFFEDILMDEANLDLSILDLKNLEFPTADYLENLKFVSKREVNIGFIQNSLEKTSRTESKKYIIERSYDFLKFCHKTYPKIEGESTKMHFSVDCYRIFNMVKSHDSGNFDEKMQILDLSNSDIFTAFNEIQNRS